MNVVVISSDELANLIQQSVRKELANHSPSASFDDKKPLSIDEAAQYLGIPKATIYQFTRQREIPHQKLGKRLVFLTPELDEWVASKKLRTRQEIENSVYLTGKKGHHGS